MLRHCIEMHQEEPLEKIEFGIKVVGYTRTSFEIQMLESVKIQENRHQRYEIILGNSATTSRPN